MAEHDALISQYTHLQKLPREKEALHSLKKIASLVKPLMRARNWKVGTLAEFYPAERNLLGINYNRGQKVCLRLRYPGDKEQFLPIEQVVDTMLHELAHNVHGPHDAKFHALWDQLRTEYEALISKGYTGEGFMSQGHKLGGKRVPRDEARRIARAAAEKRRDLSKGSGQRLGGRPVLVGTDMRDVIARAVERRITVLKGCGQDHQNEKEIEELANEATSNGFRTKAEEDEANEAAISQALWELVQEDQKKLLGDAYEAPTLQHPEGSGGSSISITSIPSDSSRSQINHTPRHMSRLVTQPPTKKAALNPAKSSSSEAQKQSDTLISSTPATSSKTPALTGWTCEVCTLHNPIQYLACDACTVERPEAVSRKIALDAKNREKQVLKDARSWRCHSCQTIMEEKWWTCQTCGTMKQSS